MNPVPLRDRLYEKFIVHPSTRCWVWIGARHEHGYGLIEMLPRRRNERAHRVSWVFHCGPIPVGLNVLHRCDRPACINPERLFLGTQIDNIADMKSKRRDRLPKGEAHPSAKLTVESIVEIRSLSDLSQKQIADRYHIGQDQVSRILARKIWKDVG